MRCIHCKQLRFQQASTAEHQVTESVRQSCKLPGEQKSQPDNQAYSAGNVVQSDTVGKAKAGMVHNSVSG